jgi:hypothetical protein
MRGLRSRWPVRAGLAGGAALLAFAALTSVGAAVSPSGTPAAGEQYGAKVTICHRTGSKKNPFRTIRVSKSAVQAHLRHGDKLGSCSTATFTLCDKAERKASKTIKVKGSKAAARHLRQGDTLGKCKKPESKAKDKGSGKKNGFAPEKRGNNG